jgi:O-acetyl-ADP-ribose deacetylase (regulator of RNase III)
MKNIHEVTGDILKTKAEVIAHGVAPNDNFHSGLALSLREQWPAMYKDFRHYCQTQHPKSGELWSWGGADHARIICLFTQAGAYGQGEKPGKATLPNVHHCLKQLRKEIEAEDYKSVALPRLATGVGGLDWKDVKPLIWETLGSLSIPIYVYTTFRAGEAALEPQA